MTVQNGYSSVCNTVPIRCSSSGCSVLTISVSIFCKLFLQTYNDLSDIWCVYTLVAAWRGCGEAIHPARTLNKLCENSSNGRTDPLKVFFHIQATDAISWMITLVGKDCILYQARDSGSHSSKQFMISLI